MLGEARSGTLTTSKDEVEEFLPAHCGTHKDIHMDSHPKISSIAFPLKELDTREPSWKEVEEVV